VVGQARSLVALALALALTGPSAAQDASAVPAGAAAETGVASWYGPDFQGRRTSSGEIYDKENLTAAHRTLPFGAYLLVRDLDNGASVVVRVNDRGPFAKDRIIDLSEAAARILGMIPAGTARVSLTSIPKEEALAWKGGALDGSAPASAAPASAAPAGAAPASGASTASGDPKASGQSRGVRVRIQVASYSVEANAKATVDRLAASGMSATIERSGGFFRIVFADLPPDDAPLVEQRLAGLGYRGIVVTTIGPAQ
jgi:rare lipoprotein A